MFAFHALILARFIWISLAHVMYSSLNLCYVHCCMLVFCLDVSLFYRQNLACVMCAFKLVLCAVRSRWLAASRLAARFARVARFASQALSSRFARKKEAPKLSCQQCAIISCHSKYEER